MGVSGAHPKLLLNEREWLGESRANAIPCPEHTRNVDV